MSVHTLLGSRQENRSQLVSPTAVEFSSIFVSKNSLTPKRPTLQEINRSHRDATERLTSDLSKISDWGRENFIVFIASKGQFLHLSARHNLPDNYALFFIDTQLCNNGHMDKRFQFR
ncbi:hypothetical protein E2C01_034859 [Portunus trituberculatus]|uniref:Uncharacterized protein n=1 Tax=Portunus trituberculatus TaxID=210409 RepID=A0A5B7F2M1_PORTR|nr:hypothetical protein [Portunus trituberculatus]